MENESSTNKSMNKSAPNKQTISGFKTNKKQQEEDKDNIHALTKSNKNNKNRACTPTTNSNNIDFNVFEQENKEKCNGEAIINNCPHLMRITNSLKYHQLLSSSDKNSNGSDIFITFCENQYSSQFLEDYIHFICVHSDINDLNKIVIDLETNYKLKCSKINQCKWTQRHYRNRNDDSNGDKDDNECNFYIEIVNTIHFYLFHLEDAGLRVLVDYEVDNDIKTNEKDDYFDLLDKTIGSLQKEIEIRRKKCGLESEKLNNLNNSKFNIIVAKKQNGNSEEKGGEDRENTFIDNMFHYIVDNMFDDENILYQLSKYILSEEYCTDSIVQDIDIYCSSTGCNILNGLNNNIKCVECINKFNKYYNITSNQFSTGFAFWYHPYYEYLTDQKLKQQQEYNYNQNDFGGHSVCELFVVKHFQSIKEEALNSKFINIAQFNEKIIDKGKKYIQTEKCKKIKCTFTSDPLHYDILFNQPLSESHLYSLILYCDFTKFCTSFSTTFRKIKWDETINKVKERNSKYFHISKYLRELIQYYGITGTGTWNEDISIMENKENGPFYTGMSFVMNIPSFSIRLNGPTSTSKQREIAVRFASRDGMVIELNNNKGASRWLTFFDSSWISSFPEEDERIYFGGRYKIEVKSIIVMETKKNYENIINSLYKFDSILSGQVISKKDPVTQNDVDVVGLLLEYISGSSSKNINKLDNFIKDTFYLFTTNKTQITLDLYRIDHVKNSSFIGFIMHSIKKRERHGVGTVHKKKKPKKNKNNLFKPVIFKIFSNLKQIIIYSTWGVHGGSNTIYSFNMLSLLSILNNISLPKSFKTIIIKDQHRRWLNNVFCQQVKQKFASKQMNVELKRNQGSKYRKEDWLIISV